MRMFPGIHISPDCQLAIFQKWVFPTPEASVNLEEGAGLARRHYAEVFE